MQQFNTLTEEQMQIERTKNYIKFQIWTTEQQLMEFSSDAAPICFAHLLEYKKNLLAELNEMNKSRRK